jgi:hypothetical protein
MKAKKIKQDFFIIIVSSFIVIVLWIGFTIYSAAVSSTIDETLAAQLIPIVPSFDMATITSLKQRRQVAPMYESNGSRAGELKITPSPTPIVTPTLTLPQEEEFEFDEEASVELLNDDTVATDEGDFIE